MRRVTLLVCGEPMRGDDGIATAIVEALPVTTRGLTETTRVGQLMPDDLLCDGPVILLDAVEGPEPGEVVDLSLAALHDTPGSRLVPTSSHALPLPIAVAVAERLGGRLPEGRFIGIATASYALGAGLSPAVRRAIPRCARHLNHWIRVLAHERSPGQCA